MSGKFVLRALGAAIVSSLAVSSVQPVKAGPTPRRYGAYSDKASFDAAVKTLPVTTFKTQRTMTAADEERLKAIEAAFHDVDPDDLAANDALAKHYGLVIYKPGGKRGIDVRPDSGGFTTFSVESDVYMYDPEIYYDSITYQVGIKGRTEWVNIYEGQMDEADGRGGPDAYTTLISNIPFKTNVKRQSFYTYNQAGTLMKSGTTLWSTSLQDRVWPVTMRWQDDGYYDTTFNSALIETWVWTSGLSSPVEVGHKYEHNWETTQLDTIGFAPKIGASKSVTLEFGATWNWSVGTASWVGESNFISF